MRNLRMFYQKCGQAKYISHLDQTRLMTRAIKRARLPVWYTEGFNPHVFLTFALPLSLGFESEYEIMDFRITDDSLTDEQIKDALAKVMPPSIVVTKVAEPVMNTKELAFARFKIVLQTDSSMMDFLQNEEILVEKYSKKKKQTNVFNIKPKLEDVSLDFSENTLKMELTLPAGNDENINPTLLFNAAKKAGIDITVVSVTRTMLFDKNKNIFL